MNKKHVSKVGKYIGITCLLFVCAMVQSCRDEYFYDDREPDFIGSSIYDYLDGKGNFTYFLRVINDLDYKDVLQRTGSKTLFVADDNAFKKGIKEKWGFDEYSQLTAAHKRMILYGAMLDNAYLLEMLSKMQSTGVNAEPIPGQCLRQATSASVTDTVALFSYREFPKNNPHWDAFKEKQIRVTLDATQPMMLHFIKDQLYQKNITEKDLRLLVADNEALLSDIYIFDKKVLSEKDENDRYLFSDITCKNGYVHQLDGLLIPPSNMAEEIRLNGNEAVLEDGIIDVSKLNSTSTQLFSRMLDRFAVPVPIDDKSEIAQNFNRLYNQNSPAEKLYEKRYFTEGSARGSSGNYLEYKDESGTPHPALGALSFDPGWNAYKAGTTDGVKKEHDMAAIFAPSDVAVIEYFKSPAGRTFMDRYAGDIFDESDVYGTIVQAIDSIPVEIIEPLVRNHMQMSFNSSVPSKFENIMDDARDPMGVKVEDIATADSSQKVILANNGVVYVMNKMYSPARFKSVISPVMLNDTLSIFSKYINDLGYDKYLLSMGNKFSLVVSSDNEMMYYSPKDEKKLNDGTYELEAGEDPKAYKFVQTISDGKLAVTAQLVTYKRDSYDPETNTYSKVTKKDGKGNLTDLFEEILEYNIVLGDMNSEEDRASRRKYYMSKGYGSVKVERDEAGYVCGIAGGRELQNGAVVPVENSTEKDNGWTIQLKGSMIQPATQSVYNVLYETPEYKEFLNLCRPDKSVLEYCRDEVEYEKAEDWEKKFRIFDDILVRMFDTYHYTIYVPTEEALKEAYAQGLPTWEGLKEAIEDAGEVKSDSLVKVVRSGVNLISKFVRYHFQDNSVYVDNVPHKLEIEGQPAEEQVKYETSALNEVTNGFSAVVVQTDKEKNTIAVRGDFGEDTKAPLSECKNVCYVIKENENKLFNVMTRDIIFDGSTISTSSYGVIHLIDNFLVYGGKGGIYDAENRKFIR